MKPYECHITVSGDPSKIENVLHGTDWFFSKIDGDIILGKGIKCYATAHFSSRNDSFANIEKMIGILETNNISILRKKIELIIYDVRL